MKIMAAMYSEVLGKAGYDVETQLVTTRDVYVPELTKGNVDVVPDYLAGIADYLNTTENGENAESITSNDPNATLEGLQPLAEKAGITMLAALAGDRPERLHRHQGVRRREQPDDAVGSRGDESSRSSWLHLPTARGDRTARAV